jgi:hypothetical protein
MVNKMGHHGMLKRMKLNVAIGLAMVWVGISFSRSISGAEFGVDPSGHFLTLKGKPFLWMGDTVWLLAQLPSDEELELYLKSRAEQGFSVIQLTAVMGEERVWGTMRRTSRGTVPFEDGDMSQPSAAYWRHLDELLDRIHAHGMRAALVVYFVGSQGDGFKYLKPGNAHGYGKFLGDRYRNKPDLIWILGGDNAPDTPDKKLVWNNLARGIAEGVSGSEDYSRVLMTYHIHGGASSSQHWQNSQWLDFNMAQTWSEYREIYPAVSKDYQKTPTKPCGLGEGAYEDGPQYPTKPIDALVIRKQACWSYFAGGYHTYGNGNVWHFDTLRAESTQGWKEALRSPGAESLRHIRRFLESIEWWRFSPDATLIQEGQGAADHANVALRDGESGSIAVYFSNRTPIKLKLKTRPTNVRWVNPSDGKEQIARWVDLPDAITPPSGWSDALLHLSAQRDQR